MSTEKEQDYQQYRLIPNKDHIAEEPTQEFQGDLATFLVVHDRIGVVVRIPDHYVNVLLRTSSLWKQQRVQLDKGMLHCTIVITERH